jgi:hypothetical protein
MDRKQYIDHYIQRLSDKKFEIYDVRRELEQQNVAEDEIKIIIRAVDEELQNRLLTIHGDQSSMFIRIGIILMVIGAGIAIGAHSGILGLKSLSFFTYGPFFVGLSMLLVGLFKRRGRTSGKHTGSVIDETKERKNISFRRKPD